MTNVSTLCDGTMVVVLMMLAQKIADLFDLVKTLFEF